MLFYFFKNEEEYEGWLKKHKNGFVFNHFGTAEMNKMHQASCYHLHTKKHLGARTNYEKICTTNYKELEQEANKVTKNEWSHCKSCF